MVDFRIDEGAYPAGCSTIIPFRLRIGGISGGVGGAGPALVCITGSWSAACAMAVS
jgi:hypothetical protein